MRRMKKILLIATTVALVAGMPAKSKHASVAEKVTSVVSPVGEGDVVLIEGDIRDIEMVEELVFATEKRGGHAIPSMRREKSALRTFTDVPEKYDASSANHVTELAKVVDVVIELEGTENPGMFKDISPARLQARGKSGQNARRAQLDAGVRLVGIGNGLYPTLATAKQYGLTKAQLEKIYWAGLDTDYTKLQAEAETVRTVLASGKEVRVTHANGTDLRFRIEGRPVFVSDGVISEADRKAGGPALQVWLPAGEVYTYPVEGSAEGKLVYDTVPYADGSIEKLTFEFKAGKVVNHTAKPGKAYDRFKELYTAGTGPKDALSVFDIGVNRSVVVPAGSRLTSYVPAGALTIGVGANVWTGGSNDSNFNFYSSINGTTIEVDGKKLVEKGELKTTSTGG